MTARSPLPTGTTATAGCRLEEPGTKVGEVSSRSLRRRAKSGDRWGDRAPRQESARNPISTQ